MFQVRPASAQDSRQIWHLIWKTGINPLGIHWRRFLVAVDAQERVLGCGQIKLHRGGVRELASIAVQPDMRGRGISRAVITRLLEDQPLPVYLTCRAALEPFYQKFGFRTVVYHEAPGYFQFILRIFAVVRRLSPEKIKLLVMVKENE